MSSRFLSLGLFLSVVICMCVSYERGEKLVSSLHGYGVASSMGYGDCLSGLC